MKKLISPGINQPFPRLCKARMVMTGLVLDNTVADADSDWSDWHGWGYRFILRHMDLGDPGAMMHGIRYWDRFCPDADCGHVPH